MSEISGVPGSPPSKEERNWALLAHLSAVAGVLLAGLGMVLGPLVIWLLKREDSEFVADQAKEALNFNITMLLGYIVGVILIPVLIGLVILPVLGLLHLVLMIVAMIRASEGERYRYPVALRLVS